MDGFARLRWGGLAAVVLVAAAGAQAPQPGEPVRVSGGLMAKQMLSEVTPVYPGEARRRLIAGSVVLRATIGRDGLVEGLSRLSGSPLLEGAAIEAAKQWTYRPYLLNGRAVEVQTTVTVNFPVEPAIEEAGETNVAAVARIPADRAAALLLKSPPAKTQAVGEVTVRIEVSEVGAVEEVEVLQGEKELGDAVSAAVGKWSYRPYVVDGVATRFQTTVVVKVGAGR